MGCSSEVFFFQAKEYKQLVLDTLLSLQCFLIVWVRCAGLHDDTDQPLRLLLDQEVVGMDHMSRGTDSQSCATKTREPQTQAMWVVVNFPAAILRR